MKAITLWQPWATLVATGLKEYETRSWAPPEDLIGRRLAIHAAKRTPRQPVEDFIRNLLDDANDMLNWLVRYEACAHATTQARWECHYANEYEPGTFARGPMKDTPRAAIHAAMKEQEQDHWERGSATP